MNHIELYVENLSENIGLTRIADTISYNNSMISKAHVEQLTDVLINADVVSSMGFVGRYTYTVEISLASHEYKMGFIDLHKNESEAKKMAATMPLESDRNLFMKMFAVHTKVYDQYYNLATLVKGSPPLNK